MLFIWIVICWVQIKLFLLLLLNWAKLGVKPRDKVNNNYYYLSGMEWNWVSFKSFVNISLAVLTRQFDQQYTHDFRWNYSGDLNHWIQGVMETFWLHSFGVFNVRFVFQLKFVNCVHIGIFMYKMHDINIWLLLFLP